MHGLSILYINKIDAGNSAALCKNEKSPSMPAESCMPLSIGTVGSIRRAKDSGIRLLQPEKFHRL